MRLQVNHVRTAMLGRTTRRHLLIHLLDGGEGGIRTHGPGKTGTRAFQARLFGHSSTSPLDLRYYVRYKLDGRIEPDGGEGGIRTHDPQ